MGYKKHRLVGEKVSLMLVFLLGMLSAHGQKEPQYTQYMYNIGGFNPAYVGTTETPELTTMYRAQWLDIPGAPRTIRLGANIPLSNEKMGIGVNVINDALGPLSNTFLDVAFSYQINLSDETKLSFGMDAGGSLLNVDFSKGTFENPGEPVAAMEPINNFYATIGAGLFLYQENWYVGVSIPNFLTDDIYNQEVAAVVEDKIHYNVIGGYVFDLSENTKLKPAFLLNYVVGAPVNVNVSANMLFNDRFTLGAAYSIENAVSALAGFQITDPIFFGVSYDYNTNGLGQYNNGTPEFVLKYFIGRSGGSKNINTKNIKGKPKQIDTPRFF